MWQTRLKRAYPSITGKTVRGRQPVRPPSVALRVAILGALVVALLCDLVFRLWFLQILEVAGFAWTAEPSS